MLWVRLDVIHSVCFLGLPLLYVVTVENLQGRVFKSSTFADMYLHEQQFTQSRGTSKLACCVSLKKCSVQSKPM